MLQQPVSKELRSFQSLSKFSGTAQKGSVPHRRQSAATNNSITKSSYGRRRLPDSLNDDSMTIRSVDNTLHRSPSSIQQMPLNVKSFHTKSGIISSHTKSEELFHKDALSGEYNKSNSLTYDASPIHKWDKKEQSSNECHRQPQVEWNDEGEFVFDDECNLPYPGFVEPALHCFSQTKIPRKWCLKMVTNPWFDRLTMIVIIINCITLGMYKPCEDGPGCNTYRCQLLSMIDHMIFIYFFLEMVIKVIALGFTGQAAYLSDTWNRLDFFIVIAGIAEYLLQEYLGNINLTAIRTIRVLRPLRAVNRIPSMRILVNLLLDTLPMLGNVLLLCFFVFFIFGIIGVQLWAGLLRNRCTLNLPKKNISLENLNNILKDVQLSRYYIPEDTSLDYICSQNDASGIHTCNDLPPYVYNGIKCNLTIDEYNKIDNSNCINWNIYYDECTVAPMNPFQNSVSFDNIGFAWVAIFLVISLEGWTDIMYYVQDAHSFWNWIYFVLLIVIGAFFMINLCLVVIATQFAETKRRETERMLQERKRLSSYSNSIYGSEGEKLSQERDENNGDTVYAALVRFISQTARRVKRHFRKQGPVYKTRILRFFGRKTIEIPKKNDNKGISESDDLLEKKDKNSDNNNSICALQIDITKEDNDIKSQKSESFNSNKRKNKENGKIKKKNSNISKFTEIRNIVKKFVICDHFTRGILVAILLNTLLMGVEYHQQPEWLTIILEYSNYFFTGLFAFEMLLKVFADGLFGYLADGFNLFDGGIVALSVLEIFQEGKGGLSVLRTFRLLRILKLVRFMPALRYQLVVMLRTMDNVTVFFGLLALFIFIFSILGMNLFGCKFCKIDEGLSGPDSKKCERKNFDSLLWALITVFQILTQEDWNMVLFNGMAQTTPWAALYFVALMTFGNYVLFNLLVAILVEGFQESKEEEKRQLEEEAKKRAEEEEKERNKELELLIAKTTSLSFMGKSNTKTATCTCSKDILNKESSQLTNENTLKIPDSRPRAYSSSIESCKSFNNIKLEHDCNGDIKNDDELFINNDETNKKFDFCKNRNIDKKKFSKSQENLIERSSSDIENSCKKLSKKDKMYDSAKDVYSEKSIIHFQNNSNEIKDNNSYLENSRLRTNSWCGIQTLFNPQCPIHSRRALIEAYARDKLIQASQELQQVLVEEERKAEERKNTFCRKLFTKTCLYKRKDYSLFLFSTKNKLRISCLKLTQKKWFDYTVLVFIGINCITLAMERPSIPPDSLERKFLTIIGYIFTIIFTLEMSLKVIANGCLFGRGAYFKDGWNILDGILVIISLINIIFEMLVHIDSPKIFGVIRVLRLLRALRPLRVINRAPGVKLVVMTLISSLKPIGNIVLICCTFFIIFGILGVQLFKGMMYHCIGPDVSNITTKNECLAVNGNKWVNHRYNFDNLGQALMSLFVLSSKDGWVSIMYQGIDAVGVDMQPIENHNEWRMIYFISFLLLVGFFVLNMFVGVVVENFHKCKEALEAEMREKARQKRLARKLKRQQYEDHCALKKKQKEKSYPYWYNYGPARMYTHNIVTSKYFDLAIAAVIGINVISMAMEFYMMPSGLRYVLKALNYFFTAVFTLEAAMKLYALGLKTFFMEKWNRLDMFIVILSIAGIIFEEFEALELPINPTIIRVMRVLRIARVLKLLKMAKGIRSLLDTVGEALPQVGNLGSLFFLLFFIFAALGVELFGKLECSDDHPCDGLGEHAHFKNFGMAFLTLFRIATGDNWNGIMKDALRDDCDPSDHCDTNCCVDPILAPCFFVVFVLISQFVLVNVVVAVLMKHLEESNKKNEITESEVVNSGIEVDVNKIDVNIGDENDFEHKPLTVVALEQQIIDLEQKMFEDGRLEITANSNATNDKTTNNDCIEKNIK
ncbi:Voltage-dependent calcium channel, T-type, alpha-1 subunit family and Ion transport domain and Voltage-dependent channel, four helix bundle domain-containing protein [Strongyloides ratti]|uniref:Voltage-dependent calcium channel, T-type, alpha-1 subunit family and Ion transport domain and Voltage-dependent channel, four helix bundle domain-containing protein n=1 Tax=Strongyloides ratti TaxID=34506 RepID=A0A090LUS5_STRRB|nr:Voltage-dependent calcium channel, T-type, alpha-1 subunit family and Ion transport domain and Voltage-dependent channel, four helix bundle domain-containing protein [Strongyloides ratti]CEF71384.1 Voltage-dependent calcium channel, T-type, alpha-1 subunit family and Ion transport domain and Voltage-dependent channel, four helix bundle domain-containing protein [Strongyloides ratti]